MYRAANMSVRLITEVDGTFIIKPYRNEVHKHKLFPYTFSMN